MSEPVPGGLGLSAALGRASAYLAGCGIATAALDARLILTETLGVSRVDLLLGADGPLDEAQARSLSAALRRRASGEPVARILGAWEFWGLPFRLSPDTLVPRPDTETLVEAALDLGHPRDAALRLLDLGTGSGCLLVALLSEWPRAEGVGIDLSLEALRTARANAARNGVGARAAWLRGDWAAALAGRFDVAVANPPYIAANLIPGLAPEVRDHDPRLALDGGADGLDCYRVILAQAADFLAPGGHLVVEIGYDQEEALRHLAEAAGLRVVVVRRDLAGHPRAALLAREPDSSGS
ncbi:protein-(glutamine-N5) methyltransferase, release factor-specific [Methylobacterium sp. 4-46]|uniref:peptide chain release factor N(5)-glutamine methyltransferase n=1 Tax=unclassified Methylobacterium TaxID=2615210 RepID=UPI000152BF68|nr:MULTISPECIES: peptide chain release factor N(5)-glutamine methyltransferase [Methylobacterium]ACA19079.1 protein-(glutamine-N5) methyltransferase, release factor-specific [Methylobacterium sp. 4-46]WFT78292.1 peptide chain release factor N(5)-glutamine methyltransferase [Methylobacterium nodulans]